MTLEDFIEERVKKWRRRYEFSDGMIETSFDVVARDLRSDLRECAERTMRELGEPLPPLPQLPIGLSERARLWLQTDTVLPLGTEKLRERDPQSRAAGDRQPNRGKKRVVPSRDEAPEGNSQTHRHGARTLEPESSGSRPARRGGDGED
jgi:hypothetical protein